jgi:hypothetical protein
MDAYMRVCMYVYAHACMHARMHIRMYAYIIMFRLPFVGGGIA